VTPLIQECLLVPFYVEGRAVGTIWAITHDPEARKFDNEDLRMLTSLGRFASSAYWAVESFEQAGAPGRNAPRRRPPQGRVHGDTGARGSQPLTPISNTLQVLRLTRGIDDRVRSACEMMERHVGQIVRFVNDMLDVSRIQPGHDRTAQGTDRPDLSCELRRRSHRPAVQEPGTGADVTLPTQPIYVNVDPTRLAQVVGNVLNNASKFTDRGVASGSRRARTRTSRHPGARHRHRHGANHLRRIFDPYTQLDTSLEPHKPGLASGWHW